MMMMIIWGCMFVVIIASLWSLCSNLDHRGTFVVAQTNAFDASTGKIVSSDVMTLTFERISIDSRGRYELTNEWITIREGTILLVVKNAFITFDWSKREAGVARLHTNPLFKFDPFASKGTIVMDPEGRLLFDSYKVLLQALSIE